MPVYFQDLNDYQDSQLFKQSLQEARRAKKGKFFYASNSRAVGGPALLMSTGRMNPDLKRALKGGSKVGGKFENREDGRLILWTDREANRSALAEDVRAILLSVGISVPLEKIRVRTPGDVKRRKKKMAARRGG